MFNASHHAMYAPATPCIRTPVPYTCQCSVELHVGCAGNAANIHDGSVHMHWEWQVGQIYRQT
eukprot:m.399712 g.399712  ORF g.399712 m.399712 type:complete len:63 (-) comp21153_c1_seq4:1741-1929(-)